MSDDLYLNVDHLVEFLAVARDWWRAEQGASTSSTLADLYDACERLFTPPESAPALPSELAAVLRDWATYVSRTGFAVHSGPSELTRLTEAAQARFVADPPHCAVPAEPPVTCSKCGHAAIGMAYHRDGAACGYEWRRAHDYAAAGEHLHRVCRRCHYEWTEPCLMEAG